MEIKVSSRSWMEWEAQQDRYPESAVGPAVQQDDAPTLAERADEFYRGYGRHPGPPVPSSVPVAPESAARMQEGWRQIVLKARSDIAKYQKSMNN